MMLHDLIGIKIVVVGLIFAGLFVAERMFSAAINTASAPQRKSRLWRNIGLWLISIVLSPLIVAPLTALGANGILWVRDTDGSLGSVVLILLVIDLVLLDLWTYGLHRAYHRVPFMWRLHEVHHRDEFLDTTSAVRFHAGEIILSSLFRLIPIALLAIPLSSVLIFETLLLCSALFHHSNIRLPAAVEARLSKILVTPSIHWVHHHALKADTNSNYASILSVWDWLFQSSSPTQRRLEMKIGVESVEDKPFLRLILMPFMRRGE